MPAQVGDSGDAARAVGESHQRDEGGSELATRAEVEVYAGQLRALGEPDTPVDDQRVVRPHHRCAPKRKEPLEVGAHLCCRGGPSGHAHCSAGNDR